MKIARAFISIVKMKASTGYWYIIYMAGNINSYKENEAFQPSIMY